MIDCEILAICFNLLLILTVVLSIYLQGVYPYFNRICWDMGGMSHSIMMAAKSRTWVKGVSVSVFGVLSIVLYSSALRYPDKYFSYFSTKISCEYSLEVPC